MKFFKTIVLLFTFSLLLQTSWAEEDVDMADKIGKTLGMKTMPKKVKTGRSILTVTKILISDLPTVVNKEDQAARSKQVVKNINQALKNGEISEEESKKLLLENCMRILNKPEDKSEALLSAFGPFALLKNSNFLCREYR
jgi:hypothetical protein